MASGTGCVSTSAEKKILTAAATPETDTAPTTRLDCLSAFLIIVDMIQKGKEGKQWIKGCNGPWGSRLIAWSLLARCSCTAEGEVEKTLI